MLRQVCSFNIGYSSLSMSDYPSAYDIAAHWNKYVSAVEKYRAEIPVDPSEFGVLGSVGLSAGAFLVSPHAKNKSVPDVQLTVFPSVSFHYLFPYVYVLSGCGATCTSSDAR